MKNLFLALSLVAALSGCKTHTDYGDCKGILNDNEKRQNLQYEVNTGNMIGAVVFSETLVIPLLVGGFWIWCPVGPKTDYLR